MMLTPTTLAAFREGDEQVMNRIVRQLSPVLYRRCRDFSADDDTAWDVVQETWTLAWLHRREFRGTGSLDGWLLRLCRTASRAVAKSSAPHRDDAQLEWVVATTPRDSCEAVKRQDLEDEAISKVLRLPDRQRSVVLYRLVAGMSTRETAEVLGCAEGTVKATLNHALNTLRLILEKSEDSTTR